MLYLNKINCTQGKSHCNTRDNAIYSPVFRKGIPYLFKSKMRLLSPPCTQSAWGKKSCALDMNTSLGQVVAQLWLWPQAERWIWSRVATCSGQECFIWWGRELTVVGNRKPVACPTILCQPVPSTPPTVLPATCPIDQLPLPPYLLL